MKILLVEDDQTSIEYATILLKNTATEILYAKIGKEAVEACHDNPDIDLILMDIRLPEMDGFEAFKKIREINKTVSVIALTAVALDSDRIKYIEAGFNGYIPKPYNKDQLLKIVNQFKI